MANSSNQRLVTLVLLVISASALMGCELQPAVILATARQSGESVIVDVQVPAQDAAKIKGREIYFSIVVRDCEGREDGFPVEPYVEGRRASDFVFPVKGQAVLFSGAMPADMFSKLRFPCAHLRGGGYLTGRMLSQPVPITKPVE